MKDVLHGQSFPDNKAVIAAVRKLVTSASADIYETENLFYPTVLLCTLYLV
jgi:hypothetical protein